jgi:hypothetical protein
MIDGDEHDIFTHHEAIAERNDQSLSRRESAAMDIKEDRASGAVRRGRHYIEH